MQGVGVDDVDAAASVHEYATHVVPADLRVQYQGCVAWPGDSSRVIIPGEGDTLLRPPEVLRCCWWRRRGHIHLSSDQLLAAVGRAFLLDHADAPGCWRISIYSVCCSYMVLLLWPLGRDHHGSGWWRSIGWRRCAKRWRSECLATRQGRIA